jgi:hypothetical protein
MADEHATLTLALDDQMSPGLRRITDQFNELQRKMSETGARGSEGFGGLQGKAESLSKSFSEAHGNFEKFAQLVSKNVGEIARGLSHGGGAARRRTRKVRHSAIGSD